MAQLPVLPISIIVNVRTGSVNVTETYSNSSSVWNGYPMVFSCTLDCIPTPKSQETSFNYNANDLEVGMWILQPNGNAFEIRQITHIDDFTATVEIKDVNLYNLLSDYTVSGNNYPIEDTDSISISLSEDGYAMTPFLVVNMSSNLQDISYWLDDAFARFQSRNLLKSY